MTGISGQFQKASWDGVSMPNGFAHLTHNVLPKADVLIFSDIAHGKADTLHKDLLSPEKLEEYQRNNVTDIFLELPEGVDYLAKQLANPDASNSIDRDDFINTMMDRVKLPSMTEEQTRQHFSNIADAIIKGREMDPPVNFHFAQIHNTPEQIQHLKDVRATTDQKLEAFGRKSAKIGASAFPDLGKPDAPYLQEDVQAVANLAGVFHKSFSDWDNDKMDLGAWRELDIHKYLTNNLSDNVPDHVIDKLANDYNALRDEQLSAINEVYGSRIQTRIDNDEVLAKRVESIRENRLEQTENPDCKTIVIHGGGHGATTQNDLDEQLQNAGLKVARVNTCYETKDMEFMAGFNLRDMSEITLLINKDELSFNDRNQNDRMEGTVDETKLGQEVIREMQQGMPENTL